MPSLDSLVGPGSGAVVSRLSTAVERTDRLFHRTDRMFRRVGDTVETPEQVAGTIRAAMKYVAPENLYPCTNCGMVPLSREVAAAKLDALAAGAAIVRREIEHQGAKS